LSFTIPILRGYLSICAARDRFGSLRREKETDLLGNYYAVGRQADPVTPRGSALLDFEEFKQVWQTTGQPLLIVVKEINLPRFIEDVGESPSQPAAVDDYLIVSKP
jgi:hypothetical protein